MRPQVVPAGLLVLALLAGCAAGPPPTLDSDVAVTLQTIVGGLQQPVFVTHRGEVGELFILEQAGRILRWDGQTLATFLDLRSQVGSGGERGLLGFAFLGDSRMAVHYTDAQGDTRVDLHRQACSDAACTDGVTYERTLLAVGQPYSNHNGGMLVLGPDGKLYLGLGDGGAAGDPGNRAQDRDDPLGKILRLELDGSAPADNPFVGRDGDDRVWAYGLRNPWRFSFDQATGDLWIGDVGQDQWEEIDFAAGNPAGVNYGWSRFEGTHRVNALRTAPGAVAPVWEYSHADGGCSVTGGYVYRGRAIPGLVGAYVYGDYCTGEIWSLEREGGAWTNRLLLDTDRNISSFGELAHGELVVVDHGGNVLQLVAA